MSAGVRPHWPCSSDARKALWLSMPLAAFERIKPYVRAGARYVQEKRERGLLKGRKRILTALSGGKVDVMPVAIDYMTLYLAERTERAYVEAYRERRTREGGAPPES